VLADVASAIGRLFGALLVGLVLALITRWIYTAFRN
jgi:hypothetical protein